MHTIDTSVPQFTTIFCGTRIVVTSELIFEVLCVPRVDHLDFPSHKCLSSISRDQLASLFCEKAMLWGGTLNFSTTEFAKGPRILNMVMTFVLTPWSHYNTITKPRARFILSLMEGLSIDFAFHMIEFIIDCYNDMTTSNRLIFPLAPTPYMHGVYSAKRTAACYKAAMCGAYTCNPSRSCNPFLSTLFLLCPFFLILGNCLPC